MLTGQDIVVTIGLTIGIIMYLASALRNIRVVEPQSKIMLLVLNNEKTAKDLSDLRLVVGTFLQQVIYYPGHVKNIEIRHVRLPVNGQKGKYNVTFNHIQAPSQIFSASRAFFNAVERKPFTALSVLILAKMSEFLLSPEGGRIFEIEGTEGMVKRLLHDINERAKNWGVRANDLDLGDVDMPEFEEKAAAQIAIAQAEATAFKIERDAQGPLYAYKELLDTLSKIPQLRFLQLGGKGDGNDFLSQVMGAIQTMDDPEEKK